MKRKENVRSAGYFSDPMRCVAFHWILPPDTYMFLIQHRHPHTNTHKNPTHSYRNTHTHALHSYTQTAWYIIYNPSYTLPYSCTDTTHL